MDRKQIKESVRLLDGDTLDKTAKSIIRGEKVDLLYMQALAKRLKNESKFNLASELFFRMIDEEPNVPFWRKELAVCLYKDPDLPSDIKYSAALDQLASIPSLNAPGTTKESVIARLDSFDSSEYLGVTAAVFKRKWRYDNLFSNILYAEHFYRKGMEVWENEYPEQYLIATPVNRAGEATEQKKEDAGKEPRGDDAGYCAINYAFVCDLIACLRVEETPSLIKRDESNPDESGPKSSVERRGIASETRGKVIDRLLKLNGEPVPEKVPEQLPRVLVTYGNRVWAFATLAEAFFGLGKYAWAKAYLGSYYNEIWEEWKKDVRGINNEDEVDRRRKVNLHWQLRSTAEQLVWLADLQIRNIKQGVPLSEMDKDKRKDIFDIISHTDDCLEILFPGTHNLVDMRTMNSKMGLALSGGGFRASLYHIGVLASLAEHDMLRHVEVLSCVSGGSILGAYYYLLLRERYNEKTNIVLEHRDYIDIVEKLEREFLEGVQQNIRSRLFSSFVGNIRMLFQKRYTRTHRLAELYEKYLYSKATDFEGPIYMDEIKIKPFSRFNPKTDNWNRRDKIPMLVLNATTLNTGHNWQFTVTWMGEPPGNIRQDVDVKKRLRRMYYEQAPAKYKKVRLGLAVGASSCVPALFAPVSMPGLYPGMDVQLVDGGVHDNQGVASVIDQNCNIVVVSDASAQMSDSSTSGTGQIPVLVRSDLIFQERMRESQLLDLKARENATQIRALGLVHLKKDLRQSPVNWTDSDEPSRRVLRPEMPDQEQDLTTYGIPCNVQQALSKIRTDLDSFHDSEAYALMYSAYMQTNKMLEEEKFDLIKGDKKIQGEFMFRKIRPVMEQPHRSARLAALLEHSSRVLFKWYHVAPLLKRMVRVLFSLILLGAVFFGIRAICALPHVCLLGGCWKCRLVSFGTGAGAVGLGLLLLLTTLSFCFALLWRVYLAGPGKFYLRVGKNRKT